MGCTYDGLIGRMSVGGGRRRDREVGVNGESTQQTRVKVPTQNLREQSQAGSQQRGEKDTIYNSPQGLY